MPETNFGGSRGDLVVKPMRLSDDDGLGRVPVLHPVPEIVGACSWTRAFSTGPLELSKHDTIVFIGNTFAERMHLFGYLETLLHARFPEHRLRVRNMGRSADELTLMPRPKGFGDIHRYLVEQEADVIFACLGMSESYKGAKDLGQFRRILMRSSRAFRCTSTVGRPPRRSCLYRPPYTKT